MPVDVAFSTTVACYVIATRLEVPQCNILTAY